MAVKIQFDPVHNPEVPTMVLAKKSGEKIGQLNPKGVVVSDDLNNPSEITFSVNKYVDGEKTYLWDKIVDFKLIWCAEWDKWFEITVDIQEDDKTVKNVYCTELNQAELSQIMLYNIEINTETDISRDDYVNPTVLYKPDDTSASLLHRIMEKAPHYKIIHVDSTIANIQKTFTFDGVSLYDALIQIGEEIDCLVVFYSNTDNNGKIVRGFSMYDLESNCLDCGHRGQFTDTCPKCNNTNILEGYGEDTTIFIDVDELANNIQLTTDTGSVKNCFKLEAGDDLMTATIRNCNPNGTDYIWYISDALKEDMAAELVNKLNSYDVLYQEYQSAHQYTINSNAVNKYNSLVSKYQAYDSTIPSVSSSIISYPSLMRTYYNTIDLALYLKSGLMPDANLSDTSASEQLALLTVANMSPVASTNITYLSLATADNIVTQMAKAIIDSRYKVDIENSSITQVGSYYNWTGNFVVTNYGDDSDAATGSAITLIINDNYKSFVEQKLQKALHEKSTTDLSITGLFNMTLSEFRTEIQKYCLDRLTSFHDACQACIDILIEQDVSNGTTWANQSPNLYNEVYVPYYNKLQALEREIKIRENEIIVIEGKTDENGNVTTKGLQNYLLEKVSETQALLDFKTYLGTSLWKEFLTYRREDTYSNSNYISDGLDNAELFQKALEFIEVAQREIYKSAELQHSISTSLKNLLMMEKFSPLLSYFSVGNWIRIQIDDVIYKLRLLKYEIDYDNLENISVEFSDVFKTYDGEVDQQSLITRAAQMATSYSSTQRQASQGEKSQNTIKNISQNGFNTSKTKIVSGGIANGQTQTWDEHGMLFRRYNSDTDAYDSIQMKIINSTLTITDDNWRTTKTAIGLFKYIDPSTGRYKETYGINGEVIVGKLLLGEGLGIYNNAGSLTFDSNGLMVTNGINTIVIDPNATSLFTLKNNIGDIISMDSSGNGVFSGQIIADNGTIGGWHISHYDLFAQFSTQSTGYATQPMRDSNGNIIYQTIYVTDSSGNPVYETDEDENYIYETIYVTDLNGNYVYETDDDGNIIYIKEPITIISIVDGEEVTEYVYDEDGEIMYNDVPKRMTTQVLIQKTEQVAVMETVQVTIDNYYNNYTVLSSRGDIALALGATTTTTVEGQTVPNPTSGAIKMYNNGQIYARGYHVDNGTGEPDIYFERKRSSGTITCSRMYSWDSDTPAFVFAFRKTTNGNYIYSTIIDENGIAPYTNNSYSCGTSSRRWNWMYSKNLDINTSIVIPNILKMRDNKSRVRNVLQIYHDGSSNYGSNLLIEAGGNTFIASGEAATNLYNAAYVNNGNENLFVISDSLIYFYTNCQTIANRKGLVLDTNLNFRPLTTAVGNLGTSSYRWNNIYSAHAVSVSSDEKIKKDLKEIEHATELIMKLVPYQFMFNFKNSDRIHYGFSAQQFKQAMDDVGIENCGAWTLDVTPEGMSKGYTRETAPEEYKVYGLRYEELIAPIVQVIQELNKRIEMLEKSL